MGMLEVIIITLPVKVGWHYTDKTATILPVVSLAHLNAGNLCNRISIIGRFQETGHQVIFFNGLRCILGIYATAPEEQ